MKKQFLKILSVILLSTNFFHPMMAVKENKETAQNLAIDFENKNGAR